MKKLFLVPLMALLVCARALAVEVNDLVGLQEALDAGGEITLTANITTSTKLVVSQANTTLIGNGFAIKSTDQYVLQISATNVAVKNIVLYAAKSKAGRGILLEANTSDIKFSLDNVTINATERGMDMMDADNITFTMTNSTVQLVPNGGAEQNEATGMPATDNYDKVTTAVNGDYSRGINIGRLTNSTIALENTTVQGFFYDINNVSGTMLGTKVTATECTFKGRAAFNIWGEGGEYVCNDCSVTGINNFGSAKESFACFVFNTSAHDNSLTINGGTVVAAVFNETGASNPNATQFMVTQRGYNNEIVINNSSYTCDKTLGDGKGGIIEAMYPNNGAGNTVEINGGTYDCPEIYGMNYSTGNTVTINGGSFDVNVVSTEVDTYPQIVCISTEVNGGTFSIANEEQSLDSLTVEIETTDEEGNPISVTIGLLNEENETIENQDGTVSVVPEGTNAATEKTDPAVKTALVWGTDVALSAKNVVVQPTQTLTLNSGTANAYRLDMGQNAIVIVKSGSTLNIGEGGVALNNTGDDDPQIIVEQGATLVLNGLMYGSVPENLVIKASAASYGQLLVNPNVQAHGDNHPNGTFEFVTRSFYENGDHYQYERFGIPTYTTVESVECDVDGLYTGIYVYENEDWQDLGYLVKGTPFANTSRLNTPFATCNLIAYNYSASPSNATYSFKGGLTGNSNASLNCNLDWNPFANSYTADVDAALFLSGLGSDANVTKAIYIAVPQGQGQYRWDGYDPELVAEYLADNGKKLVVRPMQAFILRNKHMAEVKTINYQNAVWNPGTSAGAPARVSSVSDNTARVRIMIDNGQGLSDYLNLTESATYASKVDKYMNDDVNIYAHDADDLLTILSAEDIQDTYVGFSTVQGGNFTISFPKATGRAFTLVDLETGAEVDAEQGNTYSFSAEPNTNADYRFKLVERKKVVTGISNLTDDSNAKGIYTIMGQYLGEMNIWNTLPAGVYVVDGEKRVK